MTTIAFIGLGRMGLPMASNLLARGFSVVGCDLDTARTAALAAKGATVAATAADAAAQADVTFSIIMNDDILRAVALGPSGVLAGAKPGHVFADLSTVSPKASGEVEAAAAKAGVGYVCAKVAGSIGLAETAGLTLFGSGAAGDFERCRPAFEAMAAKVHHVGEGSSAAYLKLVHSLIVGVYSSMIGEALAFGERGGLDLDTMIDILEAGPLGSRQLTLKAPILKERRFTSPPSDIDTAAKDMDLILDTARRDAMPLPLASTVRQLQAAAQAAGRGKRDIYSILETFEALAGLDKA
ncbi:NAD(P)-dependent oxidoreductase [uncultured Alsobacter sp.]|uniref:NAD(P)-dependent oxidoreductase n=1 Tax=uncultured Alsobacter sp. TaxID=1748258 RepID=UPI0025F8F5F3|nr:NAD(P)-dependent oxidoreductase [uncultured Alsobacter sp.]